MKKKVFVLLVVVVVLGFGALAFWRTSSPQRANQVAVTRPETFIDVRTDQEWEAGHLSGAVHLDITKIQQGQMPNLPKDTPIALYCRTGHRAGLALPILQQNGFTNVRNAGGLSGLQSSGEKVCLGIQQSCN